MPVQGSEGNSRSALLVIDMLNPYEHDDADALARSVETVAPAISALMERAVSQQVELIYVNDNYGDWNSAAEELADRALNGRYPDLVEPVLPPEGVSFVIKPRHTVFYETPLDYLLYRKGIDRVVLTGQVTEQCILYSALDAYVRHLKVAVPPDAVAHIHEHLADAALEMMETNMRVDLAASDACRLEDE
jgi:nicotinamidase-related amidase